MLDKVFDISLNMLSNNDLKDMLGFKSSKYFRKIIGKYLFFFDIKNLAFESKLYSTNQYPINLPFQYYQGYWQSEKYFTISNDVIKSDYKFDNIILDYKLNNLSDSLNYNSSVAVHIRCGDYVKSGHHGLLGIEYYHSAFKFISDRINNPKFFVFTDSYLHCSNLLKNLNLHFNITILAYMNNYPDYYSMYFMTLSKHNIIANSTFSWWSCWLNSGDNKLKIAPKQWFHSKKSEAGLIPIDWIMI
jgi:hypothetical protein